MQTVDFSQLAADIFKFVVNQRATLFSGAGVGKRVGLPSWSEYLEHLASVCEKHGEIEAAQLMRRRVNRGEYVEAAAIYETCLEIPEGERWKELASPFARQMVGAQLDGLRPLSSLPFGSVVTTNYDRSLHDAFARIHERAPLPFEIDDDTLRSGAVQSTFYIARIHGRAEKPTSMVLYPNSYQKLEENQVYRDFLLTLLNQSPCLFIGFSFVDPAIRQVLRMYERFSGPTYKTLHLALLPSDSSADLRLWLHKLNIRACFYKPDDMHKDLWKAIHKAQADYERAAKYAHLPPVQKSPPAMFSTFHRFFAFAYAQQNVTQELRPLRQQACDGVLLALVREGSKNGVTEQSLLASFRETLHLSEEEALPLVRDTTARLIAGNELRKEGDQYYSLVDEPCLLTEHIAGLVSGVLDRMKVREGVTPVGVDRRLAQEVLERIFVVRAWDLGAHYAGGGSGYGTDLKGVVHDIVTDIARGKAEAEIIAFERSCINLLTQPVDREAEHLAEVGRAAFALQLVLSSPRQTLLQKFSLPQKIYFDASVLLPTMVPGHPLRPIYLDAVQRLRSAAREAGTRCELLVGEPFLNEIVSHRELAVQMTQEMGLDRSDTLGRIIAFHGAENVNVFVSAFASQVSESTESGEAIPKFVEFLRKVAPYESELSLAEHLKKEGFTIVPMDFRQQNNVEFVQAFNPLLTAYEKEKSDVIGGKERILVEHEARQLVQLRLDQNSGSRAIFVSADRRLRRVMLYSDELRQFRGMIVPPDGFVGLVDIMVGLKVDSRALARLIWAAPRREAEVAIRDYLIRRVLDRLDAALARAMHKNIEAVVAAARHDLGAETFDMARGNNIDDVARTAQFMDRVEETLFEKMRWWIESQEKHAARQ